MSDKVTEATKVCKENLEKKGFEVVDMSYYSASVFEAGGKEFSYVVVRDHGTFLVDYKQQKIEHYLRTGETPINEKTNEILTEVKTMAKTIKLVNLF